MQPKGTYRITGGEEDGARVGNITVSNFEEVTFNAVCYGPGSLVDTPDGPRPVEDLRPGDPVETLDAGPQTVKWVRHADHALESEPHDNRPVLIRAGALGPARPARDLVVSPQHRILVGRCGQLDSAFSEQGLVPAKALTGLPRVRVMQGKRRVTWVHFALAAHHVVRVSGLLSESLFLGPMVVKAMTRFERAELERIFGPVPADGSAMNGPAARPFLRVSQARRALRASHRRAGRDWSGIGVGSPRPCGAWSPPRHARKWGMPARQGRPPGSRV